MRRFLVCSFLADVTQQIHSFRASGVIVAQRLFAAASDSRAFRKSDGSSWIAPPAVALVVMHQPRRASCRPTTSSLLSLSRATLPRCGRIAAAGHPRTAVRRRRCAALVVSGWSA